MSKTVDCVTIGSTVLDTFVVLKKAIHHNDTVEKGAVDMCFVLGAKNDVADITQQSGGGATNAAVTFARQRLSVALISKIGDDAAGRIVLDELGRETISTHTLVIEKGGETGQSVVLVDPDAERTILTDRGSSAHIGPADLEMVDDIRARWIYISSLNGSFETLDYILNWASEHSTKVSWNPGMADIAKHQSHFEQLLPELGLFLLNKQEAEALTERKGSVIELAHALQQFGVTRGVISDGENDLAAIDHATVFTLTPHNVQAVDVSGAGDALGSGIVASLLRGSTFKEAVEFGLSNSEHVVMHVGAETGILYHK